MIMIRDALDNRIIQAIILNNGCCTLEEIYVLIKKFGFRKSRIRYRIKRMIKNRYLREIKSFPLFYEVNPRIKNIITKEKISLEVF